MTNGITVRVLGDYGPFSQIGKSIGYQVTIGGSSFLIDCGSPLFQQIELETLINIKGLFVTHCHDDHKRWFTDLALFNIYSPASSGPIPLFTSEEVNRGLSISAEPSLYTSLSHDSERIVDLGYHDYVNFRIIGPRARYRIVDTQLAPGNRQLAVLDEAGRPVGPERAKIVISAKTGSARLLFLDPVYREWIEPESFYGFSSKSFYEADDNCYRDPSGFTISAVKAPVWHGIPGIGLKFATPGESLVFSSDTAHDTELWKRLHTTKRTPSHSLSEQEFASASIITGDINDFIERTWSEERYLEAIGSFTDAVVIHDIADRNSVVHTDYNNLDRTVLERGRTILTHSPDKITSEWVLSQAGKQFRITGNECQEVVDGALYPLNADIYHKDEGRFFVGYRKLDGEVGVLENGGLLSLEGDSDRQAGRELYRVDLYEDIAGGYFPHILDSNTIYKERADRRVELVEFSETGSCGKVVESVRDRLLAGANG